MGPSQQLVRLIVEIGGTSEKVLWEFADLRFEDTQQVRLSLHVYSKYNAAGTELSVQASQNFRVLEENI